jgi:hypothetical protein
MLARKSLDANKKWSECCYSNVTRFELGIHTDIAAKSLEDWTERRARSETKESEVAL